ncbi:MULTISPECIES: long-chain fatty acid--CoA ligase [unclassified Hydrogenophaga]|uniref:long-chain fatty acid--CoA ligase n=1 Tax=unclassified Hydrogenophaga TaxID=2610897 RepID=UPI0008782C7B|nr:MULTISPECIES: long-chain fatty acid--CoA ligase [unclassified Hydrogenophaga]MBN9372540.1 long-chain fatty acid--CoA ligase [Hydrogenophaga sp.]OJV57328.1 MAG: long-chain fatty acid--CoA ligase [Hydrogenophaga sp. 70-12]
MSPQDPPARAHHRVWPRRLPYAIRTPRTSLWDNLVVSARRYPDKPALVFFDLSTSYAELLAQAERLAAHLRAQGVRDGDRVLLFMQNCPQWVVACYAVLRANAVVVPVNPMNKADELRHYITDPDARVALCAADLAGELLKADAALPEAQRLRHLVVTHYADVIGPAADVPPAWQAWLGARHERPALAGGSVATWAEALSSTAPLPEHNRGPDDLAVLPYTSGTTGLPKGCMHPHRTLMHNAVAGALWGNSTAEAVSLLVVPLFHITGMVSGMHTAIYGGATIVLMPRWDRELAGRLISRWRVTHWTNIPTMVIDLLASPSFERYDLSSLVYIGGGGAAMPQAVAQRLLELFGLRYAEGYGLTETAAPSHSNPPDDPKQQCLGIPFMSCDARVVDPDTLRELPVGEAGEIVIHGPMVFDGYWKRPEATAAAFIDIEGKRFFRSGDLGRIDEDGYFFLTDRLKRMINASGFKVWPAEVEALMFKHPAIAEACVIATRDAYRGESVKAVVVLRADAQGKTSEADILAWCREHMAAYKCPREVAFADALPKSGSGKVMWRWLQERELERTEPARAQ